MPSKDLAEAPLIRRRRDAGLAADMLDDARSGGAIAGKPREIARRLGHAAAKIKHGKGGRCAGRENETPFEIRIDAERLEQEREQRRRARDRGRRDWRAPP